jgi:uncharacterized delta-60 repeat protein
MPASPAAAVRAPHAVESLERRVLLVTPGTLDTTFDIDGKTGLDFPRARPATTTSQTTWSCRRTVRPSPSVRAPRRERTGGLSRDARRFNANGSLDATFGSGGKVLVALPTASAVQFHAAALDGSRIVVAGDVVIAGERLALVARFNSNGTLDGTFGNGGVKIAGQGDDLIFFRDVAVDSFGKVVATGVGENGMVVARYQANGDYDNSFDGNGKKGITFLAEASAFPSRSPPTATSSSPATPTAASTSPPTSHWRGSIPTGASNRRSPAAARSRSTSAAG